MSLDVRPAGPDDTDALARLHATCFQPGWSQADLRGWLVRSEAFAVLAADGGDPVAFGLALAAGADAELLTLATRPDFRRRGLARLVLDELDREAARRGHQRWVLEVAADNLAAWRLYEGLGFGHIGLRRAYYARPDGRCDAVVLARPVGSGR
jgi:ribosomal protein S18 acetylase RimI-like enzyme